MSGGRPRTTIGTYGAVSVRRRGDRCLAETRFRDLDGRLRKVTASAGSQSAATALLKERLLHRTGYGSGGVLSLASPFGDLAALWLAELELRGLAERTKDSYRDQVRLHVLPAFENYSLGEISTGRVDRTPAAHLQRTLRPEGADGSLLALSSSAGEQEALAALDDPDDDAVA